MHSIFFTIIIVMAMNIHACTPQKKRLMPVNQDSSEKEELSTIGKLKITIANASFTATLYNNSTAKAFTEMLPITITMSDHNRNEKYNYLPHNLPSLPSLPKVINKGDIMLFGANCLVLFYKTFSTSYSYTPIGVLDNPEDIQKVLGAADISIQFETIN